ncbi:LysR family transcriptional regulator [Salibacterium aidingense]|uniref:LysR family transcriptional regulator n=1 Tax=Salibacterium aidingense TaxID=384933 RepID=UPI00041C0AAD|nr:LysR family transcriptional regulator [Salibacterium aidingense]
MHFRDWELLDSLYATKNITHAAQMLYVSQPTLTARLKHLEEHYGITIINRKRRGVSFTPEGEQLALHAGEELRRQRELEETINNMKNKVAGTLRVGVSNFFAKNKMPQLLRLFNERYPDVECRIVTGWSSEMHRLVLNHDVHLSFIKGDYPWQEQKELLYEEEVSAASPWPFTWEDLPEMPRIDYYTDERMKQIVDHWWYSRYKKRPYINIQVNQVDTCKEMVVNGLGYALLANLVVRPYPDLYVKPLKQMDGTPILRKTWMYYHEDSLQTNIVKAFVEFVQGVDVKSL